MTVPAGLVAVLLLFGAIVGAVVFVLFGCAWLGRPGNARRFLARLYTQAGDGRWQECAECHTPVCPCCGWHEGATLARTSP